MNIRIKQLATSGEVLFRDIDLAVLWRITNMNTLYTTIKRYSKNGILNRISSGIYSIFDLKTIDSDIIGAKLLHRYCYVSTETVLRNEGIILQSIPNITFISNISKRFFANNTSFVSRQLKDIYLYNTAGIYVKNGVNYATIGRAVADLLYFNPLYHFDNERLIKWDEVRRIQRLLGYTK